MAALVQKTTQFFLDGVTGGARSITGVTAGNLVVVTVALCSQPNTPSTTPAILTPAGGWSVAIAPTGNNSANGYRPICAIFYKANAGSGTHTATWNSGDFPTDTYAEVTLEEFSGCDTSSPLDVTASGLGDGVTSGNTGTTASSSALGGVAVVVGSLGGQGSSFSAPPATGYTAIDSEPDPNTHFTYGSGYKILSGAATQTASWTWTGSSLFVGVIAVFKNAAGGAAYNLTVDPASYTLTAAAETVTATRALTISPASYAITVSAVNLAVGRALSVSPASYTLSAADETLTATRALTIDPAAYSLTNSAVTLSVGRLVSVDPAAYALTVSAETLTVARALSVDPASYALTVADVTLEYATANPVLIVDPVSYVLSLPAVTLEYGSTQRTPGGSGGKSQKAKKRTYNYDYSSPKAEVVEKVKPVKVEPAKKTKKSIPADVAEMMQLLESSQTATAHVLAEQEVRRIDEEQDRKEREDEIMAIIACCL